MKAILKSIRPQHINNILKGDKIIEVDKSAPKEWKDYLSGKTTEKPQPREVLIYATKNGKFLVQEKQYKDYSKVEYELENADEIKGVNANRILNGKVVAKFTLNRVETIDDCYTMEHINNKYPDTYELGDIMEEELLKMCCLTKEEMNFYYNGKLLYAWHIDNLVVFDKPKELREFYGAFTQKRYEHIFGNNAVELDEEYGGLRQPTKSGYEYKYPLTRAPQSWCYIEV